MRELDCGTFAHGLIAPIIVLAGACAVDPPRPTPGPRETVDFPIEGRPPIDVLLVIDNSPGMEVILDELSGQVHRLIASLASGGELPDLHVGVVTSDLGVLDEFAGVGNCGRFGDEGHLIEGPPFGACPFEGRYVRDAPGRSGRIVNYTGTLDGIVRCMIDDVPRRGCGFEQPLEAMRIALLGLPVNAGFLRDEADLVILIVANEDDCSAVDKTLYVADELLVGPSTFRCFEHGVVCEPDVARIPGIKHGCRSREDSLYLHPVERFVDSVRDLKSDPRRVVVGLIAGPESPVEVTYYGDDPDLVSICSEEVATGELRWADPAVRLQDFVDAFEHGVMSSACAPANQWNVLDRVGEMAVGQAAGDACFDQPVIESTCAMTLLEPKRSIRPLPRCGDGEIPCWGFVDGCVRLVPAAGFIANARVHGSCETAR
jgi:hypothetical protein